MSDSKKDILHEFDTVIADLETLINRLPSTEIDRYYVETERMTSEDKQELITLRTRCLRLLTRIDSQDTTLQETIQFIRDVQANKFNFQTILEEMQKLRSDYEVDILTLYPRLPASPSVEPSEKRQWLNEPWAIIIAAVIGGIFLIGSAYFTYWLVQSNDSNTTENPIVLTDTPYPTLELTEEP